jgi:hypothetical protein
MLDDEPPANVPAHWEKFESEEKTQMAEKRTLVKTLFMALVLEVNINLDSIKGKKIYQKNQNYTTALFL